MKILVTGATGPIGAELCRHLMRSDHQVTVLHRKGSNLINLENIPLRYAIGDLSDVSTIENAFLDEPEIVFHLGSQKLAAQIPKRLLDINVSGTRRMLQCAKKYHVRRFIYISSAETCGNPEIIRPDSNPQLIDENQVFQFSKNRRILPWSKHLAEREVQFATAQGLDTVILNPSFVIGPGNKRKNDDSMVMRLLKRKPHFIVEGGINIIHIDDAVERFVSAIAHGKSGERYIISGANVFFSDLLTHIAKIRGDTPPSLMLLPSFIRTINQLRQKFADFLPQSETDLDFLSYAGSTIFYNNKKAKIALCQKPTQSLEKTLTDTWKWIKKYGE